MERTCLGETNIGMLDMLYLRTSFPNLKMMKWSKSGKSIIYIFNDGTKKRVSFKKNLLEHYEMLEKYHAA